MPLTVAPPRPPRAQVRLVLNTFIDAALFLLAVLTVRCFRETCLCCRGAGWLIWGALVLAHGARTVRLLVGGRWRGPKVRLLQGGAALNTPGHI